MEPRRLKTHSEDMEGLEASGCTFFDEHPGPDPDPSKWCVSAPLPLGFLICKECLCRNRIPVWVGEILIIEWAVSLRYRFKAEEIFEEKK